MLKRFHYSNEFIIFKVAYSSQIFKCSTNYFPPDPPPCNVYRFKFLLHNHFRIHSGNSTHYWKKFSFQARSSIFFTKLKSELSLSLCHSYSLIKKKMFYTIIRAGVPATTEPKSARELVKKLFSFLIPIIIRVTFFARAQTRSLALIWERKKGEKFFWEPVKRKF